MSGLKSIADITKDDGQDRTQSISKDRQNRDEDTIML